MRSRPKHVVGVGRVLAQEGAFVLTRASTMLWARDVEFRNRVREIVEREASIAGVWFRIEGRDPTSARRSVVLQDVVKGE